MITNYLIELLNDNECVIIPEFGAFISQRHSATIDYASHRFLPPYKEIVFNDKLNNNDGVLVDFISQKENITKEESLAKVQGFVNQSMAILDVNFELELPAFGKILNINGNYIFNAKENINVLGDSFGLTEFNYQPVFRTETYQIIKERIVVEQKEKNTDYTMSIESVEEIAPSSRRFGMLKTLAYTTIAFLLVFVINWTTDKSDSNFASWNPFLYSSPNEFFINILSQDVDAEDVLIEEVMAAAEETEIIESVEEVAIKEEISVEEIETVEIVENEVLEVSGDSEIAEVATEVQAEVAAELLNVSESQQHKSYYIVGGSFQTEDSAEKCLNSIKEQGFENASTLDKNDKGYIRVYYESFAAKADALIRLDEIKSKHNESAWLLFQK